MVNTIASSVLALALSFTQAAYALPQAPPSDASPSDSWSSSPSYTTPYSSTPSPYSSQYSSTTDYYPTTTESYSMGTPYYSSQPYYTSSSYYPPPNETYSPTYTTPCSSTPSPYSSQYSTTTDYYPTTTDSYSMGTPYYSFQPYYTSSSYYPPPKETYPPTTSPYPPYPPSNPDHGKPDDNEPEPNTPSPLRATYDATFDNRDGSLNNVACSNGPNGLASRFPTFGDIPNFPFIGGAFDVVWNSPNCGGCWNITNPTTGVSIQITAIDTAGSGFNIAQEAFEKLNGGQIGQGVVDVVANKVAASVCGL